MNIFCLVHSGGFYRGHIDIAQEGLILARLTASVLKAISIMVYFLKICPFELKYNILCLRS